MTTKRPRKGWRKPPTYKESVGRGPIRRNRFVEYVRALHPKRATPNADRRRAEAGL